jgi:hypothetical protein
MYAKVLKANLRLKTALADAALVIHRMKAEGDSAVGGGGANAGVGSADYTLPRALRSILYMKTLFVDAAVVNNDFRPDFCIQKETIPLSFWTFIHPISATRGSVGQNQLSAVLLLSCR